MEIYFAPNGHLQIDDARIIFKNFEGRGDKFNREGDRNFSLRIYDMEDADALKDRGWNVRIKDGRDEDDGPFMRLPVKVKFNNRGPRVYLISGANRVPLNENTIGCLDEIDIERIDMDIHPYDWEVNGRTGRTAYLEAMEVVQQIDRFAARYEAKRGEENLPF